MKKKGLFERFIFIFVALMIALSLFFLTGATTGTQIGRYQISTSVKNGFVDVYVIDTATGAVKYVGQKDENKPFEEIKSK